MPGKGRWTAALAVVAMVASGCSDSGTPDTAQLPDSISIGIGEPASLIPTNSAETNGGQVLSSLFYPLVRFDKTSNPYPVAAESITHDRSSRVWTIKLRPGFTFSNGEPVTADNYLNAWNYGAYGPNKQPTAYFFERIAGYADLQSDPANKDEPPRAATLSGLKKVNDTTFTITLTEGFSGWESVLGYDAFYPLPKAAFDAEGRVTDAFEQAPIGNGPFRMRGTWQHNDQIVVEKVAGFKGTVPKVGTITWKIYKDLTTQYTDLKAGTLDVETKIPVENIGSAINDLGARLLRSPSSSFTFVGFPTYQKEFADVDVRHALSMAIDRKELTDQLFLGSEAPATSFVGPVVAGSQPNTCGEWCEYNPVRAKQLYTKAKGPASIKITYNIDGGHQAWVDAMCTQIRAALSITCAGAGLPALKDVLDKVNAQEDVGLFRMGWTMDYPLMENYLGPIYTSEGSSNYYGYRSTAFDALVRAGSAAPNAAAAQVQWQKAERLLAKDMPVLPLRFGQNVYGHSAKVTDVTMDLFNKVDIYQIDIAS